MSLRESLQQVTCPMLSWHAQRKVNESYHVLQRFKFQIYKWALSRENLYSGFSTMYDSNRPAQLQRLATVLKFWIQKLEVLYYLGSEQRRRWSDWADAQPDHNQHFVSWIYLYPITAAADNTLISIGNTFSTCVFFESKTNRTFMQTDCTFLVFSK